MLDTQIAYLAGLIDGEGSIALYLRKGQTVTLKVQVYNTNEDVIDWCKVHFGGCKYKVGIRVKPKHSQELAWHVSANAAQNILKLVLPYLIIKKVKAEIAIQAWEHRCPTPIVDRRKPLGTDILTMRQVYVSAFREANN